MNVFNKVIVYEYFFLFYSYIFYFDFTRVGHCSEILLLRLRYKYMPLFF
jgi:hypothetical protein